MRLTVIAVGGLKEKFFREAAAEYQKRLSAYAKLEILEIAEARLRGESGAEIARALEEEGGRILQKIGPRAYVTALCVEGRQMGSVEFSEKLAEVTASGRSELVFVIGGSHGLSDAVKRRADLRLSFSEMTFPHQLMRVVLLEQLYRACNIEAGGKYHK